MGRRLSKVLAEAGVASRRACEEIIFDGRVKVNGQTVLLPQFLVDAEKDEIKVDSLLLKAAPKKVYYMLNKPKGYLCTNAREDRKIITDLFPQDEGRLFTVGRLDRDTTGLILVTNDGHFANRVIHPSFDIHKEYLVKVHEEVTDEHLKAIKRGTFIEGRHIKPIRVSKVRGGTIKVVVAEGKKREVRFLVMAADLHIRELCRIRIGGLVLGTLPIGKLQPLSSSDRERIFH